MATLLFPAIRQCRIYLWTLPLIWRGRRLCLLYARITVILTSDLFGCMHRRRSSVNFGEKTFLPENMHENLTKCPNFTWDLPEKLTKFPNFTRFLPEKIVFARIWGRGGCPFGGGAVAPPRPSVSYAYGCMRLWLFSDDDLLLLPVLSVILKTYKYRSLYSCLVISIFSL